MIDLVQQTHRSEPLIEAQAAATSEVTRLKAEIGRAQHDLHTLADRVRRLSTDFAIEMKRSQNMSSEFDELKDKFSALELQRQYLLRRSILEKLFFRVDGRPIKPLRRLLFHNSGQPRRLFRILVLHRNGEPRKAFSYWLKSKQSKYPLKTQAVAAEAVTSPRERYFLARLRTAAADHNLKDD
jgi:hypothetical protein